MNNAALNSIRARIGTTNNGKLMLDNIPAEHRRAVPELIDAGYLVRATFMRPGDAVRLP